jgi:hypothetical protein
LATAILEGTFEHDDFAVNTIAKQLQIREDIEMQPRSTIYERDYSNDFGGI